ncbi:hypothetical protein CAPN010_16600 [Capnocytophaga cynodegmi]|uniref:hypothetical protein n=1 Tax=Capnocytophaga cynodegmi TaxID=28189 RepID=UPI001EE1F010|nr:hypothetical protein [Capnocytophaga cynodegmi]GJQ07502.1 hypothetical protein CAPN010_16600 [Capnocytophaga cynodegmi]
MTTAEMLAEVTAQIRKDIPRLMELKEGCILMKRDTKYNPVYRKIVFTYNNTYYIPSKCFGLKVIEFSKENIDKDYEIIGHEIMLNDVLEWLKKLGFLTECSGLDFGGDSFYREELVYDDNGNFLYKKTTFCEWNLPSPYLKDQSEELIKFLYKLIKNKV